jgi:predicted SAM-dependent methyltransferase
MIELHNKKLYDLQFDQFSRQYIAFQLVRTIYKTQRLRILDVGGHLGKTHEFFPDDEVTVVDLYDVKEKNYVKASGLDLPFLDGEFDAVLSFDVLEHIAAKDRKKFLSELCRVSKDVVIIAAPFNKGLASVADKQVNDLYKKIYNQDQPWLAEHIENGLPDMDLLSDYAKANDLNCRFYSSNNLFLWKMTISFHFLCGDSRLPKLSQDLDRYYNQHMTMLGDSLDPSYRKIGLIRKQEFGESLPSFESQMNEEIYNTYLEKIFSGMAQLLSDKRQSIEDIIYLKEQDFQKVVSRQAEEIGLLAHELNNIKNSRAWKLAKRLSKAKNRVLNDAVSRVRFCIAAANGLCPRN